MLVGDTLPTFHTLRLCVRPRSIDDMDACLAMDRDPQVTRFIAGPWSDPVAHRTFVAARMRHVYPSGMGYWSIIVADGFIGWILLTPLDLAGPEIEIGWRLIRPAWGRGYATEAAQPILRHALDSLQLRQVVADIDPRNLASASVARKLGMTVLGPTQYAGRSVTRYVADQPDLPCWP